MISSVRFRDAEQRSFMGAVVGYGVSLQDSCLEGFDSLGFHQVFIAGIQGIGQSHKLGLVGSNPTSATSFAVVVLWESTGLSIRLRRVRFPSAAPSFVKYVRCVKARASKSL